MANGLTIDRQQLASNLGKDVEVTEQQTQAQASALGVKQAPRTGSRQAFLPKSLRIRGKSIGQNELRKARIGINQAVDRLARQANFANRGEEAKFRSALTTKLNQTSLEVLRTGLQIDAQIQQRGLDRRRRTAVLGAVLGVASGAGQVAGKFGAFDFLKNQPQESVDVSPIPGNVDAGTQFGGTGRVA